MKFINTSPGLYYIPNEPTHLFTSDFTLPFAVITGAKCAVKIMILINRTESLLRLGSMSLQSISQHYMPVILSLPAAIPFYAPIYRKSLLLSSGATFQLTAMVVFTESIGNRFMFCGIFLYFANRYTIGIAPFGMD